MIDLQRHADAHGVVGAVVGMSIGGARSVVTAGVAHRDLDVAVRRDTRFLAGSVTKAITATMIALLVDDGRLDLDTPVVSVLPEFRVADPTATSTITVRHLLTHRAGFDGDLWVDLGEGDDAIARLVAHLATRPQLAPPGTGFSYDNAGYAVLGRMVEAVTGATFEQVLGESVDGACGAGFTTDVRRVLAHPFAVGHAQGAGSDGAVLDDVIGPACLAPAGSRTWAAIDDLLAFGEWHLGRHGDAHQHRALVAMRDPQFVVADPNNGGTMALGVFLDDRWGTPVVFHDGGVHGQSAYLRILPERDAVLAVLCTGGVPQVFHRHVLADLAASSLGLAAPAAAVADPSCVPDAARYAGRYRSGSTQADIDVTPPGELTATLTWGWDTDHPVCTEPLPLAPVDECVLLAPLDGRDYVFVFPPADAPCDHLLAGLRRLNRTGTVRP